ALALPAAGLAPRYLAKGQPSLHGAFAARRVTAAEEWRNCRRAPRSGPCANRRGPPRHQSFFIHLPATAPLTQLVRFADRPIFWVSCSSHSTRPPHSRPPT